MWEHIQFWLAKEVAHCGFGIAVVVILVVLVLGLSAIRRR